MIYNRVEKLGIELSAISLGGHEYLPDGSSRGFNEDFKNAVKPGYQGQGYGGDKRRALLRTAYEYGINFLDVTIDPEKEALGRNLKEVPHPTRYIYRRARRVWATGMTPITKRSGIMPCLNRGTAHIGIDGSRAYRFFKLPLLAICA